MMQNYKRHQAVAIPLVAKMISIGSAALEMKKPPGLIGGFSKQDLKCLSLGLDGFFSDWIGYFFRIGSVISFGLDISNVARPVHSR
jgi:hypothetical protein